MSRRRGSSSKCARIARTRARRRSRRRNRRLPRRQPRRRRCRPPCQHRSQPRRRRRWPRRRHQPPLRASSSSAAIARSRTNCHSSRRPPLAHLQTGKLKLSIETAAAGGEESFKLTAQRKASLQQKIASLRNPPLVKLHHVLGQSQPQARRAHIHCELRAIISPKFTSPTVDFTGELRS